MVMREESGRGFLGIVQSPKDRNSLCKAVSFSIICSTFVARKLKGSQSTFCYIHVLVQGPFVTMFVIQNNSYGV